MARRSLCLIALLALLAWAAGRAAFAGDLRVGAASVVITPAGPVPLAGYYHERLSKGVHDDLHAKAIVLQRGDVKVALVALDLIHVPRPIVVRARRAIESACGIPGSHVLVSATHAHTAPVIPRATSLSGAVGGERPSSKEYARRLPELIARSVAAARERLAPARITAALGREETLAFNRRFHMRDGTVGWNPGKLNPAILRPAGPIDPSVPVFLFRSAGGAPLAVHVSHALHLDTVGGLEISADYPATLSKVLSGVLGEDLVTLFTIGCAGDVNHIDVTWPGRQKGPAEAARIGSVLAAAVLKTLPRQAPVADGPLQALSEVVRLETPAASAEEVAAARRTAERHRGGERVPFLEAVAAYRTIDIAELEGRPLEAEVQVITLGTDAAWVGLPGEVFTRLGLQIEEASPFRVTSIAELAGGNIGYVPTRQAWTQGNYEVVSARCAPGSGERLVEAASRLLRKAYRRAASASASGASETRQ